MIELYTDGACSPNPGLGGWAAFFISPDGKQQKHCGYEEDTTNNRMEMLAVIKGLEYATKYNDKTVKIYSDSQYVICSMTKGWRRSKNLDLWEKLDKLLIGLNVEWVWVKGHDLNMYNNICDQMAVTARSFKISY